MAAIYHQVWIDARAARVYLAIAYPEHGVVKLTIIRRLPA